MGDYLALMHEGRVVESGPPEEFRRSQHPAVKSFLNTWLQRQAQRPRAG